MILKLFIGLIVLQTNLERLKVNSLPLNNPVELNQIAQRRAIQISKNFKHDLSWGRKTDCEEWGENLSRGYEKPMEEWIKSETHYNNMVADLYTDIGVGKYKNYIVQIFCKK